MYVLYKVMFCVFCQTIQWQTYNEIITIIWKCIKCLWNYTRRAIKEISNQILDGSCCETFLQVGSLHSCGCGASWGVFELALIRVDILFDRAETPTPSRCILLSVNPGLGSGTGHIPAVLWWEVLRLRGMGGQSDPLCCVWVWDSLLGSRPFMWEPPPPPSRTALSSPQLQLQPSCDPAWEGSQHTPLSVLKARLWTFDWSWMGGRGITHAFSLGWASDGCYLRLADRASSMTP